MKKLTSVTLHTTSEGQRLSYTYSVIDEETGTIVSDNNRESRIVLETAANQEVLGHIEGIKSYVTARMEG